MAQHSKARRSWVPAALEDRIEREAARYLDLSSAELEAETLRLLERHEQLMDHQAINLYAGTNIMNPRAARLLAASVGSRPSLGYPGDKYETGMQHAERLEIMAAALICELFGCRFAEIRVASGSLANLYAYMACTRPGDRIMALGDAAAGHVTHHAAGAAGLYGLEVHEVPFDGARMTIDLAALERRALELRPRLIIVGASMCLFPYPVAEVREIADRIDAWVMFDAAHMAGLIAAGAFQEPLAEGAHVMTMSTYKSFGGPPAGLVLTDSEELARRLDAIAFPGLTANFDLAKTAALIVAALDLREHGPAYARAAIANARALAEALVENGCPVHEAEGRGPTISHQLALPAARWGGGTAASRILERANILASGIGLPIAPVAGDFNAIRLATQEVTRWGMGVDEMGEMARLMARVLVAGEPPEQVRPAVLELRSGFQTLHFVR